MSIDWSMSSEPVIASKALQKFAALLNLSQKGITMLSPLNQQNVVEYVLVQYSNLQQHFEMTFHLETWNPPHPLGGLLFDVVDMNQSVAVTACGRPRLGGHRASVSRRHRRQAVAASTLRFATSPSSCGVACRGFLTAWAVCSPITTTVDTWLVDDAEATGGEKKICLLFGWQKRRFNHPFPDCKWFENLFDLLPFGIAGSWETCVICAVVRLPQT